MTHQHKPHSHCTQCGAVADGWVDEVSLCGRCAAAADHKRLADWFQKNRSDDIHEGSLADNVIRLLESQQKRDAP